MASQQMPNLGAFFTGLGIVLLLVAFVVGLGADRSEQVLAAGALIGLGVLTGLCFVAAAIVYASEQGPRKPPAA